MIGFHIEARPMMEGKLVSLVVWRGQYQEPGNVMLGSLNMDRDEWQAFRPVILGGIRAAGYARIPISFMDGTRTKPRAVG